MCFFPSHHLITPILSCSLLRSKYKWVHGHLHWGIPGYILMASHSLMLLDAEFGLAHVTSVSQVGSEEACVCVYHLSFLCKICNCQASANPLRGILALTHSHFMESKKLLADPETSRTPNMFALEEPALASDFHCLQPYCWRRSFPHLLIFPLSRWSGRDLLW